LVRRVKLAISEFGRMEKGLLDMLVLIRWQGRKVAVPLSQLAAIDPDESTDEAIGDWHYWIVQGYIL
jgi:calcium binding protein